MNILIINYEFPPIGGGGGIATYYIARELVRKGHAVSVLTSHFRELRWRETLEDIEIFRAPVLRKRRDYCSVFEMASFILTSLPMLVALLLTRNFDLIHIFSAFPAGRSATWQKSCLAFRISSAWAAATCRGFGHFNTNISTKS